MLNLKKHHFHGTLSVSLVSAFLAAMIVFVTWGNTYNSGSKNNYSNNSIRQTLQQTWYIPNTTDFTCHTSTEVARRNGDPFVITPEKFIRYEQRVEYGGAVHISTFISPNSLGKGELLVFGNGYSIVYFTEKKGCREYLDYLSQKSGGYP